MILLALKIPFLVAAFWIWSLTDNEKYAAAAWASFSFFLKLFILGITMQLPLYGIIAFFVAWGIFYGLSYLRHSAWVWPSGAVGAGLMLFFT